MEHTLSYDTNTNKAFLLLMKCVFTQHTKKWCAQRQAEPALTLNYLKGHLLGNQTDPFLEEKEFKI